ncbi:MAG: AAA family ATPase [Candidatus Firestonebacteria bacterium]|nr:AAA family ATPase [Candidatus Firestonebacteria bacterium]
MNRNKIYYDIKKPELSWDDIGGYKEVKERLKEIVCLPMLRYDELKKLNIVIPCGVMLWGPLGVGITMLAEAAAKESQATYIYISGREILGKPEVIKEAFSNAVKHAPSVLYIADNEWLLPRSGADWEWEPGNFRGKPSTFADKELGDIYISEIDKLQMDEKRVMLIGSCYRIDVLDQSIIKEKKRFNRKVFVPPPGEEDLMEMLKVYVKKMNIILSENTDLNKLIRIIQGYTGWDIETLCRKACVFALQKKSERVQEEDFFLAIKNITPWLTPYMIKKYNEIFLQDCPHHYNF